MTPETKAAIKPTEQELKAANVIYEGLNKSFYGELYGLSRVAHDIATHTRHEGRTAREWAKKANHKGHDAKYWFVAYQQKMDVAITLEQRAEASEKRVAELEAASVRCGCGTIIPVETIELKGRRFIKTLCPVCVLQSMMKAELEDEERATCTICNSDMTLVRPGKWQCEKCETDAYIRRKQADALESEAEWFETTLAHNAVLSKMDVGRYLREKAAAIERGEIKP